MENLIVAILLYVAIVAIAHCPKSVGNSDTDPAAPIDYFPEVETTTEPETKAIAATALSPVSVATAKPEPVQGFTPDLSKMGVRDLYKLARESGIRGYKKLNKAKLIAALS